MNCARHPDKTAIGICCGCGRAVCPGCSQPGESAKLACSPDCENTVSQHDAAIAALLSKTNRGMKTTGVYTIVLGVGALVLGLYHAVFDPHPILIGMGFTIGAIFCIAGVLFIKVGKTK